MSGQGSTHGFTASESGLRSRLRCAGWALLAAAVVMGVFVLPFAFPPSIPTYSSTYTLGFNNRVAWLSTVILSVLVLVLHSPGRAESPGASTLNAEDRLPWWASALGCAAAGGFSLWLGRHWIRSNSVFDDGSYILHQLLHALRDHGALYRDIEWPYGPLLFYWPLATARLLALVGIGAWWSYVLTLAVMQALGVAVLAWVLNRLPLSRPMRGAALSLLTFGTLLPILGINYTLLRFLLPHALVMLMVRLPAGWAQAAASAVAAALAMSVSPELGIAVLAGVGGFALCRAWIEQRWVWLALFTAPLAGVAAFSACMTRDYFAVMKSFAAGGFNMVAAPSLHLYVLLMAAIVLAPLAVARAVRERQLNAAALTGFYVCSLAMLGSAFGRVDPLHTFYSGLGMYLLALVTVDGTLRRSKAPRARVAAVAWVAVFAIAIVAEVADKAKGNGAPLRTILTEAPDGKAEDLSRLKALLGGAKLAAPVSLPWSWSESLQASGQLVPSYSFEMRGAWDEPSVERKLQEMRQSNFVLIPVQRYVWEYELPSETRRARFLRFGYRYKRAKAAFIPGAFVARELYAHFEPAGDVGAYTLYRRVR